MYRATLCAALALGGAATLGACVGCSGGSADDVKAVVASDKADLPADAIDRSWVVQLATDQAQNDLVSKSQGWVSLVMNRDYRSATQQLGQVGGMTAARGHEEAAALYRQAALLEAFALIETYGKTPEPTDPVGTAHLLAVSYAITGDLASAREQEKKLEGVTDPTTPWNAPWKAWLASDAPTWPPDLSKLPMELPAPANGEWPDVATLPHYSMPELAPSTSAVDMGDPGALVALALWHDGVAHAAAGEDAAAVDTYGARYRLPVEPRPTTAPLPIELLFGSDYLVPEDGPFLADLTGPKGAAAVDEHKDESLLATMADRARIDGKLDAQKAVDLCAGLRSQLLEAEKKKANAGEATGAQRTFATVAQVGALRALALVAEAEGNREASGILRINAMELSDGATACPTGLLSLAAWDASNRYPARGTDILHDLIGRYPSLETARYGLDVLALRVSREQDRKPPGQ